MDEENLKQNEFYAKAVKYWDGIPPTVDGMLGGFGFISHTDIKGSTLFLKALFQLENPPLKTYALDCGAGIGRISKDLLLKHFKHVDLVEQNSKFLDAARDYLKNYSERIGSYYNIGLQDFCPATGKYDVIWSQWVLGHLKDQHLVQFLKKCSLGLRKNGLLIIKENVTSSDNIEIDTEDSSVTRPLNDLRRIFREANLVCVKEERQNKFPRGLFPVYMFALKPVEVE